MSNASHTHRSTRELIARAHSLHPIVIIGQKALTPTVMAEIDRALSDHELIKVRINAETKEERKKMSLEIEEQLDTRCLRIIGHIGIFYRANAFSS